MNSKNLKLVTVVAEAFVADRLIREIQRLGASGYTATPASGQGSRGARASAGERKNVKIETLVNEPTAGKILELLAEYYVPQYAVMAYVREVDVLHGSQYG